MEKVILDGTELSLGEMDKKGIYGRISSLLSKDNKVILNLFVDGVEMSRDAFETMEGGTVAEFRSVDIRELVLRSLDSAEEYLPKLIRGVASVADLLEQEKHREAMALALTAMEGMDWTLNAVERCLSLLGCNGEAVFHKFREIKASLESIMGSVVDSFEEGKSYKPALALREEVPPLLKGLEEILLSLKSQTSGTVQ